MQITADPDPIKQNVLRFLERHPHALDNIFGTYTESDLERLGRHVGSQRDFDSPGDPPDVHCLYIPFQKTTEWLRQADLLSKVMEGKLMDYYRSFYSEPRPYVILGKSPLWDLLDLQQENPSDA